MSNESQPKRPKRQILYFALMAVGITFIAAIFIAPLTDGMIKDTHSVDMQTARQIGTVLLAYSIDHGGRYPEGKSSTEIFQALIDQDYVTDPMLFYFAMPGKLPPQGKQLKPENISWDLTCCADSAAPDTLPLVFLTGYKVTYAAGASAVSLHPVPRGWIEEWFGASGRKTSMAVYYKGNNAASLPVDDSGLVAHFVSFDFDPKGKTYRQLTP
jgi:hypothetical protein